VWQPVGRGYRKVTFAGRGAGAGLVVAALAAAVGLTGCVGPAVTDAGYRTGSDMTQTGGFAFLIAWTVFLALCAGLAWLILRRH
jgi:hypothetical protein